jgi:glycoprotein 6-alpha-L-fucosyltransferase
MVKCKYFVFITGDVIGVAGNHWNGYNKGRNHRSNQIGLYPEYKTDEEIKIVDFPTYPQVKV